MPSPDCLTKYLHTTELLTLKQLCQTTRCRSTICRIPRSTILSMHRVCFSFTVQFLMCAQMTRLSCCQPFWSKQSNSGHVLIELWRYRISHSPWFSSLRGYECVEFLIIFTLEAVLKNTFLCSQVSRCKWLLHLDERSKCKVLKNVFIRI